MILVSYFVLFLKLVWFLDLQLLFICFSNALPNEKYVNLNCSIILLWSDGNISSPLRYSYLPILPYGNADVFGASLLIFYFTFSSLILSSIVMIIKFYILSKRFFLKREKLSDARVVLNQKRKRLLLLLVVLSGRVHVIIRHQTSSQLKRHLLWPITQLFV